MARKCVRIFTLMHSTPPKLRSLPTFTTCTNPSTSVKALVALNGGHLVYLELQLTPTPMAVESDDSDDLVETSLARPKATFKSGEGGGG